MNILHADFFRFWRDRSTYFLLTVVFLMPPLTCLMYNLLNNQTFTVEKLIFQSIGTDILCVLLGLHISMFVGKEYANNTIRNKLCYGEKRSQIAACFFLESILIALLYVLVSVLSSLLFGTLFGTFSFSNEFYIKFFCQIAIIVAFALVISGVVISSKNMKAGLLVTVLISVIFTAISYALPMLAARFPIMEMICRSLYMIVSTMLISSVDGVYYIGSFAFQNIYLNACLLSLVYSVLSIVTTLLVVNKQSYK